MRYDLLSRYLSITIDLTWTNSLALPADSTRPPEVLQPDGLLLLPPRHPLQLLLPDGPAGGRHLRAEDALVVADRHANPPLLPLLRIAVLLRSQEPGDQGQAGRSSPLESTLNYA